MGGPSGEREHDPDDVTTAVEPRPAEDSPAPTAASPPSPAPSRSRSPDDGAPASPPRDYHRWLAPLMVGGTFLFFVVVVGLLYYKWIVARPPNAFIVVEFDERWIGADVTVDGLSLMEPYEATLVDGEHHRVPFYLRPGSYTVTLSRDGWLINEVELEVPARAGRRWNLREQAPTTQPVRTSPP